MSDPKKPLSAQDPSPTPRPAPGDVIRLDDVRRAKQKAEKAKTPAKAAASKPWRTALFVLGAVLLVGLAYIGSQPPAAKTPAHGQGGGL